MTRCLWWRTLTSVIIFPLVLFLSRWLALFCFCCSTRSLVVRYSRANSLRILLKRWMLTSRTAYTGWPRNNRKAWNLQMHGKTSQRSWNKVLTCKKNDEHQQWLQIPLKHPIYTWTYLLIIRRCTIFRMMILSAQSLRKSDIFCFNAGFISCFAMTLRWSHDALHLRSIWARLSWSWSKSTWQEYQLHLLLQITKCYRGEIVWWAFKKWTLVKRVIAPISE